MSKLIALGDLWRITFTGKRGGADSTYVATDEVLIVALGEDDARAKFPWVVDLIEFDKYVIDRCEKVPGRMLTISHKEKFVPHEKPDVSIKREDGTDDIWQKVFGQKDAQHKYVIVASTTCFAKNMVAAEEKMRRRLADGTESVRFHVEEVELASAFAMPKDQSVFEQAHIIGLKRSKPR